MPVHLRRSHRVLPNVVWALDSPSPWPSPIWEREPEIRAGELKRSKPIQMMVGITECLRNRGQPSKGVAHF